MLADTITVIPYAPDELVCLWNVRSDRWQEVADWLDTLYGVERVHLGRYGCSVELAPHLRKATDVTPEVLAGLQEPRWEADDVYLTPELGTAIHLDGTDAADGESPEPWQQ
jgi:hypothetical protein